MCVTDMKGLAMDTAIVVSKKEWFVKKRANDVLNHIQNAYGKAKCVLSMKEDAPKMSKSVMTQSIYLLVLIVKILASRECAVHANGLLKWKLH